jgi:hypothetical protein
MTSVLGHGHDSERAVGVVADVESMGKTVSHEYLTSSSNSFL